MRQLPRFRVFRVGCVAAGAIGFSFLVSLAAPEGADAKRAAADGRRHATFDADPGWESFRSRLVPENPPLTRQEFGYRPESRHAKGRGAGEVGGRMQRSVTPATYAKAIAPKTLDDKLSASGRFSVTQADGGSGALFGWFNEKSRGWRTPNSLAFRVDGNGGKYWVFYEYGTSGWLAAGGGAFEGERYQTTKTKPFAADGTPHDWSLVYEPDGNDGHGLITFTLDGKAFPLPLLPGHKKDGAAFDRFGLFNLQTTGGALEFYVDDLVIDGEPEPFDKDPGWKGVGNQVQFEDRVLRPLHDFGFSPTRHAGGAEGEVGGIVWRDETPAYYADTVGPFSLEDELYASGKIAFEGAGSDSGVYVGFFDAESKQNKTTPEHQQPQKNLLAVYLEGPSRIGHYFRPACRTADGEGVLAEAGPIVRPDGKVHEWSFHYEPDGADGRGRITVKFDESEQTLDLRPGDKERGATFDRFGLLNAQSGGHFLDVYFDELTYSAEPSRQKE